MKPENIEGVTISYKDENLEIKNSNLNLSKIYNNYPYLSDNLLWLSSFCECCKKQVNIWRYMQKMLRLLWNLN